MWKTFYQEMPSDNCKIVALYGDGSGANVFIIKDGAIGELEESPYENEKATFIFEYNKEHIEDMGYFMWAYLPDNFKLWGEECITIKRIELIDNLKGSNSTPLKKENK